MLGKAIYSRLTTFEAVAALVADRVYPHRSPPQRKVYPLITYRCSGDEDELQTYEGESRLTNDSFDIACIAESYAAAQALHAATKLALNGQRGTWGGVVVQGSFKESGSEDIQTVSGTDKQFFIVESSYTIWFLKG